MRSIRQRSRLWLVGLTLAIALVIAPALLSFASKAGGGGGGGIGSTTTASGDVAGALSSLLLQNNSTARQHLGANDASNLTAGIIPFARLPLPGGVCRGASGNALALTATGIVCDPVSGIGGVSVTSGTPDIVITPSPGTGTFSVSTTQPLNELGSTSPYTILSSDMGKTVTHNSSSAVAVALPQAGTTGFAAQQSYTEINRGAGVVTITPVTSTINGASTLVLQQNVGAYIISDGTNYIAFVNAAAGASLSVAQTFTAAQRFNLQSPTMSSGVFTPNFDTGNNFTFNLTSACPCTIANPSTTLVAGGQGFLRFAQDGTGSRTIGTWGGAWNFTGGTPLTLSTTSNAVDVYPYSVRDSSHIDVLAGSLNQKAAFFPNNLALDGTTSSTASITSTPVTNTLSTTTSGDIVYVYARNTPTGTGASVSSISDTAGLSWSLRATSTTDDLGGNIQDRELWSARAPSPLSSDVITVNYGAGVVFARHYILAVKGVQTSPFDTNGGLPFSNKAVSTVSTTLANTISTNSTNTMLLNFFNCTGATNCTTITPPAGSTNVFAIAGSVSVDIQTFTAAQTSLAQTYSFVAGSRTQALFSDAVRQ